MRRVTGESVSHPMSPVPDDGHFSRESRHPMQLSANDSRFDRD
jgi:hypothetical protein